MRSWVLAVAMISVGCGTEPVPESPRAETPFAVLERTTGSTSVRGRSLADGAALDADDEVVVARGAMASLRAMGATVELRGPARLVVASDPSSAIWLVEGTARVTSTDEDVRVATPEATVWLSASGEVWIASRAGTTRLRTARGLVEVTGDEVDSQHRPRALTLEVGATLVAAPRLSEPSVADVDWQAFSSVPDSPPVERLGDPAARLDEALRWFEAEARRGHELSLRRRAAIGAHRSGDAEGLRRALVAHSQSLYQLRRVVVARWDRMALRARADGHPSEDDVAQRRERMVNLLGA